MAKKIKAVVKLQIPAGKANPAPPIGPALATHGINIMAFCKEYNAKTQSKMGQIIPCRNHHLPGRILYLRFEIAPDRVPAPPGSRYRKRLWRTEPRQCGQDHPCTIT